MKRSAGVKVNGEGSGTRAGSKFRATERDQNASSGAVL